MNQPCQPVRRFDIWANWAYTMYNFHKAAKIASRFWTARGGGQDSGISPTIKILQGSAAC